MLDTLVIGSVIKCSFNEVLFEVFAEALNTMQSFVVVLLELLDDEVNMSDGRKFERFRLLHVFEWLHTRQESRRIGLKRHLNLLSVALVARESAYQRT